MHLSTWLNRCAMDSLLLAWGLLLVTDVANVDLPMHGVASLVRVGCLSNGSPKLKRVPRHGLWSGP